MVFGAGRSGGPEGDRHLSASTGMKPQPILIVDDDPGALNSLRFLLESEGYSVVSYAGGAELLHALRTGPIGRAGCLILDFKMPGMDGLDLYDRLRQIDFDTPVILMTGHPDPSIATRARAVGLALIEKPLSQDMLLSAVRAAGGEHPRISP